MGNLTAGNGAYLVQVNSVAAEAASGGMGSIQRCRTSLQPAFSLLLKLAQRAHGAEMDRAAGKQVSACWQKQDPN